MTFWDQTLPQLLERGGWVMWPLLACSVFGLALICDRLLAFGLRRSNLRRLLAQIKPLVELGLYDESMALLKRQWDPLARVAEAYIGNRERTSELREEIVGRVTSEAMASLERRLNWLGIVTNIAPLLGLLGTVTGLVGAFHQIELRAGQVQPADLAAGIWEALLTTVFGLVIAIPCSAVYHALEHRLAVLGVQAQWLVSYLNEWLNRTPARKTSPGETEAPIEPSLAVAQ